MSKPDTAGARLSMMAPGGSNTATGQRFAFVTLVTTDTYLPGALVLAQSLRQAHSPINKPQGFLTPTDLLNLGPAGLSNRIANKKVDLVCFVTPATVSVRTVKTLLRYYDKVVGVEPLSFTSLAAAKIIERQSTSPVDHQNPRRPFSKSELKEARRVRNETRRKLALLGRPDLGEDAGAALTKLHTWRLTGYDKIVYLDADILVLRPIAHLFSITSNLAASPDIGWPDSFNTGMMVLTPSLATFSALREFAIQSGSWDGADQGLLNDYFGGEQGGEDVGPGGGWQRLPFRYNVTPNAGYTFTPAYQRYGAGIMAAHFIGPHKPWNRPKPNAPSRLLSSSPSSPLPTDHESLLYLWHLAFEQCYPNLAKIKSAGLTDVIHTERGVEVVERAFTVPSFKAVWDLEGDALLSSSSGAEPQSYTGASKGSSSRTRRQRAPSASSLFRGAGQAEDLKEMFNPSIVAASAVAELEQLTRQAEIHPNEGIYVSLPLDARTSLMAAKLDSGDELDSADSDDTIVKGARSRDSGNSTPSGANSRAELPSLSPSQQQVSSSQEYRSGEWSPPKVSWDPAHGSPPKNGGSAEYQMRNPIDNFYVNAWDQPLASQPRGKQAFFTDNASQGPSAAKRSRSRQRTLERLQREHFFDNLGSDQPDARKVKPVFPWEASQSASGRHGRTPSRIFPDEEPASVVPGSQRMTASLVAGSSSTPEWTGSSAGEDMPADRHGNTGGSASPAGGLPDRIAYANAWDQVKSIERYAARRMPMTRNHQGVQAQTVQSHRSTQTTNSSDSNEGQEHDNLADQSGDGDNESSSSEDDEVVERGGATWRREGPGPGYQRKAGGGGGHQASGSNGTGGSSAALRSPRASHQPLSTRQHSNPAHSHQYGNGSLGGSLSSQYFLPDHSSPLARSSSSSGGSQNEHAPLASIPIVGGSGHFPYGNGEDDDDDVPPYAMPYDQLLASFGAESRRRMGMSRTPTHSRPGSARASGASSPTSWGAHRTHSPAGSGAATPINLSPRQSRTDLATYIRLATTRENPASSLSASRRSWRHTHSRTQDLQ